MPSYQVLAEIHAYVEVEADNAEDAQMKAFKEWQTGEFVIDESPIFYCEEADLIEED
jgi:hypothetical protein